VQNIASPTEQSSGRCRVVWWFRDGKPGHENQARGLLRALSERGTLDIHQLPVNNIRLPLLQWLFGRFTIGSDLPVPDLIIGAGHATHLPMLAARRAYGGRVVVLMKPSLPISLFDLAIIPAHDGVEASERVVVTRGVLNNVVAASDRSGQRGLLLIGGPSKHHHWSDDQMLEQITEVVSANPEVEWLLTSSRRTPPVFLPLLRSRELPNLEIVPCEQTGPDWLPQQLERAAQVWVSEDSVSMTYEALTSGAVVGVLPVAASGAGRVVAGVEALQAQGLVTTLQAWREGAEMRVAAEPFNEAQRCAGEVVDRWLSVS